jgi:A/G-specific adenine glycosylase
MPAQPRELRFKRLLLKWYRTHARRLPWRETRDPYRVLVSEFMLQQTQVSRVLEYYPRFLRRFPSLEHLARARPRAVREAWDGLGYYARAANLHALARTVTRDGGAIPRDPERLRRLPGVGRYTAGAVACFAYEKRAAAVDTNVKRVLTRVFGLRRTGAEGQRRRGAAGQRGGDAEVWSLAQRLLPRDGHAVWQFNQALMELGARLCVTRKPRCPACPVRPSCITGRQARRA